MTFWCKKEKECSKSHTNLATADQVRQAFIDYRDELDWMALFLTGDPVIAEACVLDASSFAIGEGHVFEEWLERWVRRATILSAIAMQKARIAQLGAIYEQSPCIHHGHSSLAPEIVELVKQRSETLVPRMDLLCRCAVVLRGMEDYTPHEASLLVGLNRLAFDAAYCAALQLIAVLSSEFVCELVGDTC